jgi:hypothetical protein
MINYVPGRFRLYSLSILLGILGASGTVLGGVITSFPGVGTTINFDNLVGGNCHLCGTSVTTQYAALGVTFNNPTFPGLETADTDLDSFIPSSSSPNALFVYQGGGQTGVQPFQILFSTPVNVVGFDWLSSFNSSLQLDAYDTHGMFLETVSIVGTASPQGLGGFSGLEESVNIGRLDVSYHPVFNPGASYNFSMDNLTFAAAPEPSGLVLASLGLLGTILLFVHRPRPR